MHFTSIIFGLIASVSAIDIYFHNSGDCSGAAAVCSNANPNFCCTGNSPTVAYRGVPTNWNIDALGFSNGGCGSPKWTAQLRGQNWVCMTVNSRPNYTGSYYYFAGRKRAADTTCEGSVAPDTLVLADGVTKYDIAGLDEARVEELVSAVLSCVSASLPAPGPHRKQQKSVENMR